MTSTNMRKNLLGRKYAWLLLGSLAAALPLAAATARIYVANRGGTTIDVIDTATNKVVEVIKGIESPEVIRFSPDGSRLYITSRSEDVLDVRDRKSGKTIKKVPLSGWANDAGVTSDGKLIVICIRNTGTEAVDAGALDIIDSKSLVEGEKHSREKRAARRGADRGRQVRGRRLSGGTVHNRLRSPKDGNRVGGSSTTREFSR